MLAKVDSAALVGIEGVPVSVEVDVGNGLPSFTTVGLPDSSVRESKDRVKAAIKNSGYQFPTRKITVNLAPASIKKEGPSFDLPIALGILATTELFDVALLSGLMVAGELSLDGSLMPVNGVLSIALAAAERGCRGLIIPFDNGPEAALIKNVDVIAARRLYEVVEILTGLRGPSRIVPEAEQAVHTNYPVLIEHIKGQSSVKRAMEIAAAGMHNIVMQGPPGTGKTMLARALPSILPDWSFEERIETTRIHSTIHTGTNTSPMSHRPFRAPHHTVSDAGLIGGGSNPRPGEVSLAHNGVLFLDELPEFKKRALEVLRQPLEDGCVTIARAHSSLTYPARFMLVAAMNPCPCGYYGDHSNICNCNEMHIQRYRTKISGPLLDRIDMHIEVARIDFDKLCKTPDTETSAMIRERVDRAHKIQSARFRTETKTYCNAQMRAGAVEKHCEIDHNSKRLLSRSVKQLNLSARAYHKILKIARTIADLGGADMIGSVHVAEAIQYRRHEVV